MSLCYCMGPQNGEPACPCDMKNLKQVDGRWVKVIDYGPVDYSIVEERYKNSFTKDTYHEIGDSNA